MKPALVALAAIAGGLLLHRLFLWMERRDWIYYRHNKPSRTALGNAFLGIQSILEPDKKHVIEVRDAMRKATEQSGDDGDQEADDEEE
jgi:hypothetical protein